MQLKCSFENALVEEKESSINLKRMALANDCFMQPILTFLFIDLSSYIENSDSDIYGKNF